MKKIIFILLSFPLVVYSQTTQKSILRFQSYMYKLSVTKSEALILTTRAGEVAMANSLNDYWRKTPPSEREGSIPGLGLTIDNSNFFNKDTGFVSGFINNGSKYNIIYRTTDNGKTWSKIDFGQDGWVDDAVNLDNGKAWMSVSGSGIAYTENYGATWRKIDVPEKKQRFAQVFFSEKQEGIIGSLSNMIALTTNNGKQWQILPTPLDQNKYTKTDKESRAEVNGIAIYKDYFLVNQEGLVFYSAKDSINWKWLPKFTNFYTDTYNSALYFKTKNGFVKTDDLLIVSDSFVVTENTYNATCRNGMLFIMCGDKILKLKDGDSPESAFLYTDEPASIEPQTIAYSSDGIYGNIHNKLYLQKEYNGKWEYLFDLPFSVDSGTLSMPDKEYLLFTSIGDSLKYFNIISKELLIKSKKGLIEDFSKARIDQIVFNKGSSGCFHRYNNTKVYTREDNEFVLDELSSKQTKGTMTLENEAEIIDLSIVDSFVSNMPGMKYQFSSINDLEFTDAEYQQCKQDILDFKESIIRNGKGKKKAVRFTMYQNNLDFDRLLSLVDSVKTMTTEALTPILFQLSDMYSTTTNWISVDFITNDKRVLTISNHFYEANAFSFPWQITTEGYSYANTCIEINRFLNKVYADFLGKKDKVSVLHTIVKRLY